MDEDWKRVSCHGNIICFLAAGVFPVELLAYQVSISLCYKIGQDMSIYILDIISG